jgi:hypothetical protein
MQLICGNYNKYWGKLMKQKRITPDWTGALCAETDPELFFPDKTNISNGYLAKKICNRCFLKQKCFEYAIKDWELKGIWGGTSERERWEIRAGRRKAC